jgi:hypothetical protein
MDMLIVLEEVPGPGGSGRQRKAPKALFPQSSLSAARPLREALTVDAKRLQIATSPLTDSNRRPPPYHEREEGVDPCRIPLNDAAARPSLVAGARRVLRRRATLVRPRLASRRRVVFGQSQVPLGRWSAPSNGAARPGLRVRGAPCSRARMRRPGARAAMRPA